jgi:SAM-dependent methyltransferase
VDKSFTDAEKAETDPVVLEAYRHPHYYDIALGVADVARELDFFEAAIRKFSLVPVRRVFELAAGTAPYLDGWHGRGYEYCGLDLSAAMLDRARDKARRAGIAARFILADMRDFAPEIGPFDLAYVLLGSLYTVSNREFLDHLDRVAAVLPAGGLYLLDSVVWFEVFSRYRRSWTRRKGGVTVHTSYRAELRDPIAQTYDEHLTYRIDDRGAKRTIETRILAKVFFPQEFLCLVELSGRFEFLGWYNDFDLSAPVTATGRHIVVLRKR